MGWSKKFKKNFGRTALGVGTLGASELAFRGADMLKGKEKNMEQVPLETEEQRQARVKLMDFANTGQIGDFKIGEDPGIEYGNYDMTGLEGQGQTAIQGLLNLDPSFTDPLRAQMRRQIEESNTALKRNAGFAGNLYSTNTIRNLGDVEARGNETMMAQLANLRMKGIDASQRYGGLSRELNNARVGERNQEILRRRAELQMPLETLATVSGTPVNFGIKNMSYRERSPYMDLLELSAKAYGDYKGGRG